MQWSGDLSFDKVTFVETLIANGIESHDRLIEDTLFAA